MYSHGNFRLVFKSFVNQLLLYQLWKWFKRPIIRACHLFSRPSKFPQIFQQCFSVSIFWSLCSAHSSSPTTFVIIFDYFITASPFLSRIVCSIVSFAPAADSKSTQSISSRNFRGSAGHPDVRGAALRLPLTELLMYVKVNLRLCASFLLIFTAVPSCSAYSETAKFILSVLFKSCAMYFRKHFLLKTTLTLTANWR